MSYRLTGLLFVGLPAVALAEEAHHVAQHGESVWPTFVFSIINAAIFIWVLRRFAWPVVQSFVQERKRTIVTALDEAARVKGEAEALRDEVQQRVNGLAGELEEIRSRAREQMALERASILAEAHRSAENIVRDARKLAEHEAREAAARLREEVARRSLKQAREMATAHLTAADQNRFLDDFVRQVSP